MIQAPELDIDKVLFKTDKMPPHCRRERRVVANLIDHLGKHGFQPVNVFDGDEDNPVNDMKSAMEVIFNLDDSRVYFKKPDGIVQFAVLIILGNDLDCIADYAVSDVDGWNAAIDSFDAELYA